jgi:hypothetical protein
LSKRKNSNEGFIKTMDLMERGGGSGDLHEELLRETHWKAEKETRRERTLNRKCLSLICQLPTHPDSHRTSIQQRGHLFSLPLRRLVVVLGGGTRGRISTERKPDLAQEKVKGDDQPKGRIVGQSVDSIELSDRDSDREARVVYGTTR